jgi:hypothetical protein
MNMNIKQAPPPSHDRQLAHSAEGAAAQAACGRTTIAANTFEVCISDTATIRAAITWSATAATTAASLCVVDEPQDGHKRNEVVGQSAEFSHGPPRIGKNAAAFA